MSILAKHKYLITQEEVGEISHYKRMFELNADRIKDLCSSEKSDVVYGFELGQIYSHLRDCFSGMMTLENDIIDKKVEDV